MPKYRLYGDICRAAIIEVEAPSVEALNEKIKGDPIDLDELEHEFVQEERKCASTINDEDRRLWILNDEGLYNWWRDSGLPITTFIRANRGQLDEVIGNVTSGRKRQHYLVYG